MLTGARGEEGQAIVLFVVMFSVILIIAGFAIDQGFWYGRRRVVQKDADLAARSGALVYIGDRTDNAGAESRAARTARNNGVTGAIVTDGSPTCSGVDASGRAVQVAAPSIEVQLLTEARRFFTGLGLVSTDRDPVEVGASATACVGRVARLYVANGDDPDGDDNTLKGIPIALRNNVSGPTPNACFSGSSLLLGEECVIYGPKTPAVGIDPDDADERRMLFTDPNSGNCDGGDWNSISSEIRDMEDGLTFTCSVNASSSCASGTVRRTSCVSAENINQDQNQERVFQAMEERLRNADGQSDCDSREGGEPEQSFQNAFGNGDGQSPIAPDPPPLGGSASTDHVYVQNDCYGNPRIVVLPIISGGDDDLDERPVRGFATVYVTGCYHQDDPGSVAERERNDCSVSGGNNDNQRGRWQVNRCGGNNPEDDCFWEIRGIPVHIFVSDGSLGGIDPPNPNAPLTIQTVE
jgi:hypothetical protein